MNTKAAIISSLLFLVASHTLAQERAKTDSGRTVILNANGTWEYITASGERSAASQSGIRAPSATTKFELGRTGYSFYFDAEKWQKSTEESGRTMFQHKNGDGFATVIVERISVPLDRMASLALQFAKRSAPDARMISQESRTVNGSKVVVVQMSATMQGIPFIYLNYYFSGSGGTVQVLTYTASNLFPEYRTEFEEFLNGIVAAD